MRKRLVAATIAIMALTITAAALASAKGETYLYTATVLPQQEVPKPAAPATAGGTFTAIVTENGTKRSIRWALVFHNLSGKAVAAHIHMGKPGVAGGVILTLCGPCISSSSGHASISTAVGDTMEKGNAYVNVHTAKNAGGEIRGAVKLVGKS
jgi:hypothetical protein